MLFCDKTAKINQRRINEKISRKEINIRTIMGF